MVRVSRNLPRGNDMKIIAGLVIGFYVMLAIVILFHMISRLRHERYLPKDQRLYPAT
jgi:hypothetical protein